MPLFAGHYVCHLLHLVSLSTSTRDNFGSEFLDTDTGEFRRGPALPTPLANMCAVMYEDWKVLLVDQGSQWIADLEDDMDNPGGCSE